jgi:CheY-like chemotaxis protein
MMDRPDLSRVTALVVDHDVASIELLEACLQPFGARVVSARSAFEAQQRMQTMIPDIVICDLALPDQNGLEFIRWLRARSADQGGATPAIAVTFLHERFGVRETRAAGFDMFVRKPIDPTDIVQAVTLLVMRAS